MEEIRSKIDGSLLHIIWRSDDFKEGRQDIVPDDNYIQCSALVLKEGHTFRPHKHIKKDRHHPEMIAQESWIVVKGSVKCIFYDKDDIVIAEPILKAGDASFSLGGGHNYLIIEEDTIVYEYKTGPYEGQKYDKVFINNEDT